MLLMGLQLGEGISATHFLARTGTALDDAINPEILDQAIDEGYIVRTAERLRTTSAGRMRLDALLASLLR